MVTLKEAIETAQLNVQVLANERHRVAHVLGMLSGVVSSLPEGGDAPIRLAREACEALIDRAHEAEDADLPELAERLRGIVRDISPVITRESASPVCRGYPACTACSVCSEREICDEDSERTV